MQWSGDTTTASVGHATTSRYSAWFLEKPKKAERLSKQESNEQGNRGSE